MLLTLILLPIIYIGLTVINAYLDQAADEQLIEDIKNGRY